MTDSADSTSINDRGEEAIDEKWAAFDEIPAATSDCTDEEDFPKKESVEDEFGNGQDDGDEWNDFEFASAPPVANVDHSEEKPEPTVSENQLTDTVAATATTSLTTAQIQPQPQPPLVSSLSVDTLICDLGQILNNCLNPASSSETAVAKSEGQSDASGEEASIDQCADDHDVLSSLADLVGESDQRSLDQRNEGNQSDTMAGEILALWTSLRLLEEAAALKYQWGESKIYDRHLQALRMDLKLAKIRNPKLPAFAWQLSNSALTPEKPVGPAISNQSSSTVGEHKSAGDDCVTPADGAVAGSIASNNHGSSRVGGGSANGTVVAPVQFDWGSSGLRNPLSEGIVDSGSMDLDYFSSNKSVTSSSLAHYDVGNGSPSTMAATVAADAWKSDLKLLGLMAEDDSSSPTQTPGEISQSAATVAKSNANSANLLDKLMNSNHRTTSGRLIASSSESSLSAEARRLLDTLPDLSFMLSPVLMFPIREDLGRSDGGDDVQL